MRMFVSAGLLLMLIAVGFLIYRQNPMNILKSKGWAFSTYITWNNISASKEGVIGNGEIEKLGSIGYIRSLHLTHAIFTKEDLCEITQQSYFRDQLLYLYITGIEHFDGECLNNLTHLEEVIVFDSINNLRELQMQLERKSYRTEMMEREMRLIIYFADHPK